MSSFSKLPLFSILALLAAIPAQAQDWRGFYIGGNVGYGISKASTKVEARYAEVVHPVGFTDGRNAKMNLEANGTFFGAQVGYNWQSGKAVFGIEGDVTKPDSECTKTDPIYFIDGSVLPGGIARTSQEIKLLGSVRARIGYAPSEKWLAYLTAGLVIADVEYRSDMDYQAVPGYGFHLPASYSDTMYGTALGAGVEYALGRNLSMRAECLFYDLPKRTRVGKSTPVELVNDYQYTWDIKAREARLGVNLRF